jgi:hypothetical protein
VALIGYTAIQPMFFMGFSWVARLAPENLLTNREQGVDWLFENHGGITPETVQAVFDFYDRHNAGVPHPASQSVNSTISRT